MTPLEYPYISPDNSFSIATPLFYTLLILSCIALIKYLWKE